MCRASFIVLIWFQVLPPYNVEVVDGNIVTSDVAMVIYGPLYTYHYILWLIASATDDSSG